MTDSNSCTYNLKLSIPDRGTQFIPIINPKTIIGDSPKADIQIANCNLDPEHCVFRLHNDVLSIHHLGKEKTYLNKQLLQNGRMYVVEEGDKIKIGKIQIDISSDELIGNQENDLNSDTLDEPFPIPNSKEDHKTEKTISLVKKVTNFLKNQITLRSKESNSNKPEKPIQENKKGSLLKMFKKKPKKPRPTLPSQKSKKKETADYEDLPGPLVRIYALITNLAFAYGTIYFIFPFAEIDSNLASLFKKIISFLPKENATTFEGYWASIIKFALPYKAQLTPHLDKITKLIPPGGSEYLWVALEFYCLFVLMDLLVHVLLGSSLPFFLLSIKTDDSFIIKRIKAFFRSLFGAITMPLIIFELPVLFRRRTLKEVLSFSHYGHSVSMIKTLTLVFLFPIIIITCITSPLVRNFQYTLGLSVAPKSILGTPKKEDSDAINKLKFIPYFSRLKKTVTIYDPKKNKKVHLSLVNQASLTTVVSKAGKGNPLFPILYPSLNTIRKSQAQKKQPLLFDPDSKNEIIELLRTSMSLNTNTFEILEIHQFLLEHGPFINGYVSVRDHFLDLLKIPFIPQVSFPLYEKTTFIQFNNPEASKPPILLMPIASFNPNLIEISFKKETSYLANFFLLKVMPQVRWRWNQKKFATQNEMENALQILNYINLLTSKNAKRQKLAQQIIQYYESLAQKASSNNNYAQVVQQAIRGTVNYLKGLDQTKKDQIMESLEAKLNNILTRS